MVCSVKRRDGTYSYFEAPHAPAPSWGRARAGLGIALDDALPALPAGARMVGTGPAARGVVCRPGSSLSLGATGDIIAGAMLPLGLLVLWLLVKET
jgi:hypothetical protein